MSGTAGRADGPMIEVSGLTKRFGGFCAVDDLTIAVDPGSIFAFLGANGSGKSTTIRMLIGLLAPTAGAARVDGVDVIASPRRVRDHIGYMGQKVSLYQGLSLHENVEFYAGLHGLAGAQLAARWGALCERFALASAEAERPENLPAGIRQRAGLALAMLHRPRVLFLDEPTAGVDVDSRGLFWDIIQDEAHAGTTVFVTTHFLEEVDYCDWVCFIDQGRLIANDAPEALRLRYGGGYRVRVDVDAGARARVAQALASAGLRATADGSGFTIDAAAGIEALRAPLARALAGAPAHLRIEMPLMTDVFRELIRRAEIEAREAGAARAAGAPSAGAAAAQGAPA